MEQKITKLSEREKSRNKISVWYGSADNFEHGLREVISNSIDEIHNNFDKGIIDVTLHDDLKTITVRDTGRGIPIEGIEEDGTPNYELLFLTLFASTKYDNNETGQTTIGVNGLGTTVLNYTSDLFDVKVGRNGKIYRITFEDGGYHNGLEIIGDSDESFTEITFRLSNEVYTCVEYDKENIKDICNKFASCSSEITINFKHKNEHISYNYDGIEDYFNKTTANKITSNVRSNKTTETRLDEKNESDTITTEIVFSACNSETKHQSFLNLSYLSEQGTIHEGIINGIRISVNKYLKDKNLYQKNEKQIIAIDVENSISYVASILSTNVSYANQTKFSTAKKLYKDVCQDNILKTLEIYSIENPLEMEKLSKQVLISMRARIKSSKMMENVKKKLSEEITIFNRPQGLLDCKSKDISENRLFIAEGQSAKSGLVLGRDRNIDAIFPIRGKILNCLKADYNKIFDNDVILNIIRILGCGVEVKTKENKEFAKFDINKCKYGKIIIATDSDKDGFNIRALLLTLFYRLMPSLITEGRVYLVEAPLFEIEYEGTTYYAVTDKEKDDILKSLGNKNVEIGRNKGLGETSKEATADTIMNPNYKGLYKITMKDLESADKYFELFMGDKVAPRKEYIIENFDKYCDDMILDENKEYSDEKDAAEFIIENEMPYATYTITERALPQIEDGLKPSQRRGMYIMKKANITHNKPRLKSQNVEGRVMALHPHSGIYPTLARMARNDTLNLPFLDPKGAMGIHNSDDINESSGRYTEIRLSEIAQEYFNDIDKGVVPMIDNYDNSLKEPKYLPVTYPAILCNTSIGIATGFSSNICPYNFKEVCENASKVMLGQEPDVLIPDFSTGGYIVNHKETFHKLHNNGTGTIKQRGKYEIVEDEILFTELPYMSTVEKIEQEIIDLIKNGTLKEVLDVSNDTDKNGLGLSIKFKKNTNVELLVNKLYKLTNLENNFSCNFTVLYKDRPVVMGVKEILSKWCESRLEMSKKAINCDLEKINKERHLYEGIYNISEYVEDVISVIRSSNDDKETIEQLRIKFPLDEVQAKYIADLQLKKLNKDNIMKQYEKLTSLNKKLRELTKLLDDEISLKGLLADELKSLPDKYKVTRKSHLIECEQDLSRLLDILIEDYNLNIVLSKEGYLKKVKLTSLRGASEYKFKDGDSLLSLRQTSNKNDLLVFTNKQNCYKLKIHELTDHKPSVLGLYLPSHLQLEEDETIIDVIPTNYTEELLIAYANGKVARVPLVSYQTKQNRSKLANATYTEKIAAMHIYEDTKYILATEDKALIFNAKDIPSKSSRTTQGITTMKHANMGEVITFRKVSECTLDTQSRYIGGKAGKRIFHTDII